MPVAPFIPTVIGGGAAIAAGRSAEKAAGSEGDRVDQLERERFAEAKRQADLLREAGDEAQAVALEEATRAEFGAQKFEALSQEYAERAENAAQVRETEARNLYDRIQDRATAREEAGASGARNILRASREGLRGIDEAAERAGDYLGEAFTGIEERYSPYLQSERAALGQLGAEFGLNEGDVYRGYRDTPAYEAAMDASRVAEQESIDTTAQELANTGSLYSGRRGAALVDRAQRGSYERAGVEQAYYQNYLNMLQGMAQPTATSAVSGYEAQIADRRGQNYIGAARDRLSMGTQAAEAAERLRVGSMRTGDEGAYLINALPTGTEGAEFALGGMDRGTAGSPYRLSGAQIPLDTQAYAGGMITGNMPGGLPGAGLRLEGVGARNAAISDIAGGIAQGYSSYLTNPKAFQTPIRPPTYYGGGT